MRSRWGFICSVCRVFMAMLRQRRIVLSEEKYDPDCCSYIIGIKQWDTKDQRYRAVAGLNPGPTSREVLLAKMEVFIGSDSTTWTSEWKDYGK